MEKYYIDACIWRDYFEDRRDNFRPLGEWAFRAIRKIISDEDYFVISDLLLDEIRTAYPDKDVALILGMIPEKLLLRVDSDERQSKEAYQLMKRFRVPFKDALHAIIAMDNEAILVTRDKHFYTLYGMLIIKKPEELI